MKYIYRESTEHPLNVHILLILLTKVIRYQTRSSCMKHV